ncbi:hypothetical protein RclHR1_02640003 [Rhizophagus clarus]|uniref:Uncharacterized protein n=1 Tax=Rhizophagus clarus TaxID=94130 RepID=A0A2Z6RE93_9GLOM|nr:hypothetical protein RclHR1_02640003 [Rhizophagus clarus]
MRKFGNKMGCEKLGSKNAMVRCEKFGNNKLGSKNARKFGDKSAQKKCDAKKLGSKNAINLVIKILKCKKFGKNAVIKVHRKNEMRKN